MTDSLAERVSTRGRFALITDQSYVLVRLMSSEGGFLPFDVLGNRRPFDVRELSTLRRQHAAPSAQGIAPSARRTALSAQGAAPSAQGAAPSAKPQHLREGRSTFSAG